MQKTTVMVYCYKIKCESCNQDINVYYTVPDFGDSPVIRKCKHCGQFYWYTAEDECYIKPLAEQMDNDKCEVCGAILKNSLIPTHKFINCCGYEFSLDDDFAGNIIPPNNEMVPLEVYLIYS